MIKRTVLIFILCALTTATSISFGQTGPKMFKYVLRIESADADNPNVAFAGTYAFGDSVTYPALNTIEKMTPFTLQFSAERFIGLFQDKSRTDKIKVHLAVFQNGKETGSVDGRSDLNVLHADGGAIGYGWPTDHR